MTGKESDNTDPIVVTQTTNSNKISKLGIASIFIGAFAIVSCCGSFVAQAILDAQYNSELVYVKPPPEFVEPVYSITNILICISPIIGLVGAGLGIAAFVQRNKKKELSGGSSSGKAAKSMDNEFAIAENKKNIIKQGSIIHTGIILMLAFVPVGLMLLSLNALTEDLREPLQSTISLLVMVLFFTWSSLCLLSIPITVVVSLINISARNDLDPDKKLLYYTLVVFLGPIGLWIYYYRDFRKWQKVQENNPGG